MGKRGIYALMSCVRSSDVQMEDPALRMQAQALLRVCNNVAIPNDMTTILAFTAIDIEINELRNVLEIIVKEWPQAEVGTQGDTCTEYWEIARRSMDRCQGIVENLDVIIKGVGHVDLGGDTPRTIGVTPKDITTQVQQLTIYRLAIQLSLQFVRLYVIYYCSLMLTRPRRSRVCGTGNRKIVSNRLGKITHAISSLLKVLARPSPQEVTDRLPF